MLFAATCIDKPNSMPLRLETRPAHLAFLKGLDARVKAGGALLTPDQQAVVGSLLILEGETKRKSRALLANDPYARAGLFASVDIKPWRQAVGVPLV